MPRSLLARLQFAALAGLVLFDPNEPTTTPTPNAPAATTPVTPAATPPAPAAPATPPAAPETDPLAGLTPEQTAAVEAAKRAAVNAAITPKVTAERTKWEADLQAMAEAANQTAEQQAQAAATAARADADAAIAKANDTLKAADAKVALLNAKVPADRIPVALKSLELGDVTVTDGTVDATGLAAAVQTLIKDHAWLLESATTPTGSSGANMNGKPTEGKPANLAEALAARQAAQAA